MGTKVPVYEVQSTRLKMSPRAGVYPVVNAILRAPAKFAAPVTFSWLYAPSAGPLRATKRFPEALCR